jgi:hypothetical protein
MSAKSSNRHVSIGIVQISAIELESLLAPSCHMIILGVPKLFSILCVAILVPRASPPEKSTHVTNFLDFNVTFSNIYLSYSETLSLRYVIPRPLWVGVFDGSSGDRETGGGAREATRSIATVEVVLLLIVRSFLQKYILDMPKEVLSTAFGQMIAPSLGGMQGRLNSTVPLPSIPQSPTPFGPKSVDVTAEVSDSLRCALPPSENLNLFQRVIRGTARFKIGKLQATALGDVNTCFQMLQQATCLRECLFELSGHGPAYLTRATFTHQGVG